MIPTPTAHIFLYLALLVSVGAAAQPNPGIFKRIADGPQGLSQEQVRDVLQDRDGFVWIATSKGLYRYDGHDLRVYRENPLDTTSISDSYINVLAEDRDGSLWIGTGNAGLVRYDRYLDRFTRFSPDLADSTSLSAGRVTDLLVDSVGRLWVATPAGLDRLDRASGRFVHYRRREGNTASLSSNLIGCLAEDVGGRIWAGTDDAGLNCLDPETGAVVRLSARSGGRKDFANNRIRTIARGEDRYLWFSLYGDARFYRLDPISMQTEEFALFPPSHTDFRATSISPDGRGALWMGTHYGGLLHFDPKSGDFTHYRANPAAPGSLPSDQVKELWLNQAGVLWIGHPGAGLTQLITHPSGFEILPLSARLGSGLLFLHVQCIMEGKGGEIWIATRRHGLFRYGPESKEITVYHNDPGRSQSLAHDLVLDLVEDQKGFIWIATHNGLQRLDPQRGTFETFGPESGLRDNRIRSLWEDHTGRLWIGTFGGLHRFDPGADTIHYVDSFPGYSDFLVNALFEDSQGYLWAAAFDRGVFRLDLKNGRQVLFQKRLNDPSALTANRVYSIVEDLQGSIWLGTEGGGLNRFIPHPTAPDSSTFRHWRPYNSDLADEIVFDISVDGHNRLWLSTDGGLFSFDPQTQQIKTYSLPGKSKGLNAVGKSGPGGALYVGNVEYAYRFHPDSLWQNDRLPPVFMTELRIKGRPVPIRGSFGDSLEQSSPLSRSILYTSSLDLQHRQNDLTFLFTALNYIEPEKNRYRYKMEGYDEEWIETDASNRRIRYTNLSPGNYTFRVMARNNEGILNPEEKTIALRIHPPWWRSPGAKAVYVLLFFGGLWAIRRYEIRRQFARSEARRLQELDAVKTKLYTNITHEFRTPLTIILGLADQIKSQVSEHVGGQLQLIRRNGRQLLRLVNQMLDLSKLESGGLQLNLEQGDVVNYLQYLLESFHSYAASKKIRLHFICEHKEFYMDYDPVRLMHVVSNLLSNAVKFTPEGKNVYVTVSPSGQEREEVLEIRVKDTGIGIPEEKLPFVFDRFYQGHEVAANGTGIGLTLAKELVKLMGGQISVRSELGKGSEFTVLLPVSRRHPVRSGATPGPLPDVAAMPAEFSLPDQRTAKDKPLMLIVEDNHDLVRYLIGSFNPAYNLEVAYNGRQGIDKARALLPDIIVTDVMMPEADGFELCANLKSHQLTSHIPIIMLTAKVDVESRLTGLRRGADAYLEKPFLQEELHVRIQALLAQRKRLQAYYRAQAGLSEKVETERPHGEEAKIENAFLAGVNEIIEKHISEETFTVEQLCGELFIDPSNLYRKLRALTGLNPSQYIRSLRLARARKLLVETDLPISSVAAECGFAYQNYFSRIFKKETGLTPSKYRAENRS
jgi:signal transduction histidine kinase/ligand-binding sensor domain-containing protein/DNA-binding response OmpR family regulator